VSWDTVFLGLTEKYKFTPDQINNLTRNQLVIYSGAIDDIRDREKVLLNAAANGMLHTDKG
jgi:hypothetical protein